MQRISVSRMEQWRKQWKRSEERCGHCDRYPDGRAGINKRALARYGGEAFCFMSDEDVAATIAKTNGTTRATASMDKAAAMDEKLIFAIGNAPTALVRLYELIEEGKLASGADHRCAGRICERGAVEGTDHAGRSALYCSKRKQRGKVILPHVL